MKKGIHLKYRNVAELCGLFTTGLEELAVEGKKS